MRFFSGDIQMITYDVISDESAVPKQGRCVILRIAEVLSLSWIWSKQSYHLKMHPPPPLFFFFFSFSFLLFLCCCFVVAFFLLLFLFLSKSSTFTIVESVYIGWTTLSLNTAF